MSDLTTHGGKSLDDNTVVWFCPNHEWVSIIGDDRYRPCGALCGPISFGALPQWAKYELALAEGWNDE